MTSSLSQSPYQMPDAAQRHRVPVLLLGIALIPLLVPLVSPHDDGPFIYPFGIFIEFLPILFCLRLAAALRGLDRLPWLCIALQFLCRGLAYIPPSLASWHLLSVRDSAWITSILSSSAFALTLCAFAGIARLKDRRIALLDCLSVSALACLLIFSLTSPSVGFRHDHLIVSFAAIAFMALLSVFSCLGATTAFDASFSFLVSAYLIARVMSTFLINIVDYTLLSTPYILPSDLLLGFPPLVFCWLAYKATMPSALIRTIRPVQPLTQSLFPASLVIGGLLLVPYAFGPHPFSAGAFLLTMFASYAARTHLLHRNLLAEQLSLQSHANYLEELATRDALTGIGNRRSFDRIANHLLLAGSHPCFALLVLDTDDFKGVNDRFGHLAGDEVLRLIATLLQSEIAHLPEACCARLGGDEFIGLLPGCDREQAVSLAERLRQTIRAHAFDLPLQASVSIGIALAEGNVSLIKMIRSADAALYLAKANGRNRCEVVDTLVSVDDNPGSPIFTFTG